jgi:hypothetical protein
LNFEFGVIQLWTSLSGYQIDTLPMMCSSWIGALSCHLTFFSFFLDVKDLVLWRFLWYVCLIISHQPGLRTEAVPLQLLLVLTWT